MKGAAQLFNGPQGLAWGEEVETPAGIIIKAPIVTTGLYAIEVGSGHVYALAWDWGKGSKPPPAWERLP